MKDCSDWVLEDRLPMSPPGTPDEGEAVRALRARGAMSPEKRALFDTACAELAVESCDRAVRQVHTFCRDLARPDAFGELMYLVERLRLRSAGPALSTLARCGAWEALPTRAKFAALAALAALETDDDARFWTRQLLETSELASPALAALHRTRPTLARELAKEFAPEQVGLLSEPGRHFAVHRDAGGRAACRMPGARHLTSDRESITCFHAACRSGGSPPAAKRVHLDEAGRAACGGDGPTSQDRGAVTCFRAKCRLRRRRADSRDPKARVAGSPNFEKYNFLLEAAKQIKEMSDEEFEKCAAEIDAAAAERELENDDEERL